MQIDILNPNQEEVILFFSGFGSNKSFFEHLHFGNKQIVFISNYQDNTLNLDFLKDRKITLIAWSMGVAMANRFLDRNLFIQKKIAINGTLFGIDKTKGIPPLAFRYTMERFDFSHFKSHLFESKISLTRHFYVAPKEVMQKELQNLYHTIKNMPFNDEIYDSVLISVEDKIFSSKNQILGWKHFAKTRHKSNAPHFVFFDFEAWEDLCNL